MATNQVPVDSTVMSPGYRPPPVRAPINAALNRASRSAREALRQAAARHPFWSDRSNDASARLNGAGAQPAPLNRALRVARFDRIPEVV